jgi:polypeptide N-acetylgalactosaminyltransferase
VHSVLDRSDPKLLKEVILVDDFSDLGKHFSFMRPFKVDTIFNLKLADFLGDPLKEYVDKLEKVKLVRNTKREGLIR